MHILPLLSCKMREGVFIFCAKAKRQQHMFSKMVGDVRETLRRA